MLLILLLSVLLIGGPSGTSAAPQAVVLGPRQAVRPEPIIIPDEEAIGQPMDQVVDPLSPEVPVDEDAVHPDAGVRPVAEVRPAGPAERRELAEQAGEDAVRVAEKTAGVTLSPGAKQELKSKVEDKVEQSLVPGSEATNATTGVKDEEKVQWGLYIGIIVVLLAIVLIVGIWFLVRHNKKKKLRAQGLNAEVTAVKPVITPDGQQANLVTMEPLSAPTTDTATPTAGGQ